MQREIALNPIHEIRFGGEFVLKQKLEALTLDDIRFIIEEHSYDPFDMLSDKEMQDKEYLIEFIIERANGLSRLGQVFRVSR